MPGGGQRIPERPKRLRSSQPECLRYCIGGSARIVAGLLIGLIFVSIGTLCVVAIVGKLFQSAETDFLGRCLGFLLGLVFMGVGWLSWYVGFCTPEWMTLDRGQRTATKQVGVLYFRRMTCVSLLDFTEVSIFPSPNELSAGERFEVALTGPGERRFSLGDVTLSYDLAREFGEEVATFLGLPLL